MSDVVVGIVLLAAGASTRMGMPKQLLTIAGESLLRRAARTAVTCAPTVVVLGAAVDQLRAELSGLAVQITVPEHWQEGMAASLQAGLTALETHMPGLDAVLVILCDQPLVDATLLQHLIALGQAAPLVACAYGEGLAVPALFHRSFFPALRELRGDRGARAILAAHRSEARVVSFPGGIFDLDTLEDYRRFLAMAH